MSYLPPRACWIFAALLVLGANLMLRNSHHQGPRVPFRPPEERRLAPRHLQTADSSVAEIHVPPGAAAPKPETAVEQAFSPAGKPEPASAPPLVDAPPSAEAKCVGGGIKFDSLQLNAKAQELWGCWGSGSEHVAAVMLTFGSGSMLTRGVKMPSTSRCGRVLVARHLERT